MSSFGGAAARRSPPRGTLSTSSSPAARTHIRRRSSNGHGRNGSNGSSGSNGSNGSSGSSRSSGRGSAEMLAPETSKPRPARVRVRVHAVRGVAGQVSPRATVQLGNTVEQLRGFDHPVTFEAEDMEAATPRGMLIRVSNKIRGKDVAVGTAAISRLDRGMTTEWLPLLSQGQKKGEVCVSLRLLQDELLPSETPSTDSEDGSVALDPKSDDESLSHRPQAAQAKLTPQRPPTPPPPPRRSTSPTTQPPQPPPPPPPRRHSDAGPTTQPLLPSIAPPQVSPPPLPLSHPRSSTPVPATRAWQYRASLSSVVWRLFLVLVVIATAISGWRSFWRSEELVDCLAASLLNQFGASRVIGPDVHLTIHDAADGLCFVGKDFRTCSSDAAWRVEVTPHRELALVKLGSKQHESGCLRSKPKALFGTISFGECGAEGTAGWYFNAGMLANDGYCLFRKPNGKAFMGSCMSQRQHPVPLLLAVAVPSITPRPILLDRIEPLLR